MNISKKIVLVIISLTVLSCTSTKLKTQKMDGYNEKIESLVVSTLFSEYFEKATDNFIEGMTSELNEEGIKVDHYPYPEIKNDSLKAEKQMEIIFNRVLMKGLEFQSSHTLLLADTKKETISRSTSTIHDHYLIGILIDIQKEQIVWQADIKLRSGDYGNSKQSGTSLAKNTIEQLREDGLLKSGSYTLTVSNGQ